MNTEFAMLYEKAKAVRQHAYAPYSHFCVGASVLAVDGRVFVGCNVENSSYGLSICAERSALVSMVSAGVQAFQAVAVVGSDEGSWPCGACCQVLLELAAPQAVVLSCRTDGTFDVVLVADLLRHPFRLKK